MNKKIHLLPENVINQIAAGEVIESPVSVLKELIDNAIDANAQTIAIETLRGGLLHISIEDDGDGMSKEDLALCVQRHATSKISTSSDLFKIKTMGFRGEALSSISSIAKIKILSSTQDGLAYELLNEGGKTLAINNGARKKGTSIQIRNIFFNTPVRKKFQKSPSALNSEIIKLMYRYALCYPNIYFSLSSDKKTIFKYSPKDFFLRIIDIFGKEFSQNIKYVECQLEGLSLYGYLGLAKYYKKTRAHQYFFMNHRPIFSSKLSTFLKKGYGTRISEHHYPVGILCFQAPLHTIDVNVHPQKKEVRIEREDLFEELIFQSVKKSFEINIPTPKMQLPKTNSLLRYSEEELFSFEEEVQTEFSFSSNFGNFLIHGHYCILDKIPFNNEKGIYIADLKRIYLCLIYELFSKKDNLFESQSLIVPITIDLLEHEIHLLQEKIESFQKIGIEIRIIGKRAIAIDTLPNFLKEKDIKELFPNILAHHEEMIESKYQKKLTEILSSYMVKKNDFLKEEALCLLRNLQKCKDPFYTPNGNPTFIQCEVKDIKKLFNSKSSPICQYSNV